MGFVTLLVEAPSRKAVIFEKLHHDIHGQSNPIR